MKPRKLLSELPPSMAERAVIARTLACTDPKSVHVDPEFLPWVFHEESELWLSFDGNYSRTSPAEKAEAEHQRHEKQVARSQEMSQAAQEKYEAQLYWSKVRRDVLERDEHRCRLCGCVATSPLHIHHILKRIEGGTDHSDNLLTVCSSCHSDADHAYYSPNWEKIPDLSK